MINKITLRRVALISAALAFTTLLPAQEDDAPTFELSPFVVATTGDEGYRNEQTSTGTLVAMDMNLVPMDVTVLDESLLEDVGLYNADDLGALVASVSQNETANTNGGGGNTVYNVRGFRSVPRRNGFAPGGRLYDMTGVQRVEVIKGPNSVLYGQTDPGGIINFVPKRPLFNQRATTSVLFGSDNHFRFKGDVTGPIGKGQRFAYRLPVSYREYEREFDFFKWDRFVAAPSVLARFGRTTELVIEGEYIRQNVNLADMAPWQQNVDGLRVWDVDRRGLGREFNRLGPLTASQNTQRNVTAELTTKFTENITLRAMWTHNERDTKISNMLVDNVNPRFLRNPPLLNRAFWARPKNNVEGYKIDLLWEKNLFGIDSKTVLGYERNRNWFKVVRYNSGLSGNSRFIIGPIPNPLNGDEVVASAWEPSTPWGIDLTGMLSDEELAQHQLFRDRGNQSLWHNVRLTETMYLMDDKLILLGGIARGDVERVVLYNETSKERGIPEDRDDVVYNLGATYRASEKIGIFANTSTSFIPVYRTGLDGTPLEPQTGIGYEIGFHLNLLDDALFATITYFDITNEGAPNQLPADPDNGILESYWVNAGEQQAKGIEIEVNWNVTPQLEIFASFVAFNGEITKDLQFPNRVGLPLQKSPETSAQLTVNYKFAKESPLKGLRLGGLISYKSEAYQNPTGQIGLVNGAYTVVNIFGRYRLPWGKETDVFFNAKNILDEDYLNSGGGYGLPFQIDFGTSMRF